MSTDDLEKEVRVEFFRDGAPGGQHVGRTVYPLRVTHLPTGIVIIVPGGHNGPWSQHRQRQLALEGLMSILTSRWFR